MASREVLVVLVVCAAVSIQAAPLANSRFLRAALSPLLSQKRSASFDNGYGSNYGSQYSSMDIPSYISNNPSYNPSYFSSGNIPSFGPGDYEPSFGPGGYEPSFGSGGYESSSSNPMGGSFEMTVAAMELMSRGCTDPLIGELAIALTELFETHFLESDEMAGALGGQAGTVNQVSEEGREKAACVIGNIENLQDLAALAGLKGQDAEMLPFTYGMYVSMGEVMVAMLDGQKELIDDPQELAGIDLLVEIWDIAKRMGLLELE